MQWGGGLRAQWPSSPHRHHISIRAVQTLCKQDLGSFFTSTFLIQRSSFLRWVFFPSCFNRKYFFILAPPPHKSPTKSRHFTLSRGAGTTPLRPGLPAGGDQADRPPRAELVSCLPSPSPGACCRQLPCNVPNRRGARRGSVLTAPFFLSLSALLPTPSSPKESITFSVSEPLALLGSWSRRRRGTTQNQHCRHFEPFLVQGRVVVQPAPSPALLTPTADKAAGQAGAATDALHFGNTA